MKQKLIQTALATTLGLASFATLAATPAQWHTITSGLSVSLENAIQSALKAAPGAILDIEVDDGDGQGVRYEAEVLTAAGDTVEIWVDGASGQARVHEHNSKAKRKDKERVQNAKVDIQEAIRSALTHTPGKAVKAELDNHWGTTTYKIDVLQADFSVMELKIDAANGKVLRAKKD